MLLIITGSDDGTVDRLVKAGTIPVFRFNVDLFSEYSLIIKPGYWSITNPTGYSITSNTASRVLLWKAFSYGADLDPFLREELFYICREIYHSLVRKNLLVGNSPDLEKKYGKIYQLEIASKYFRTPNGEIRIGSSFPENAGEKYIVKSLTSGLTSTSKAMFTQSVNPSQLSRNLPWYVQNEIISPHDVTVLVLGSELYAFRKSRLNLDGLDWRKEQFTNHDKWEFFKLREVEEKSIQNFCQDLQINWGRIDFMIENGSLVFLEVNFNGQWVFLDFENKIKLVQKVMSYFESAEALH